GRADDVRVRERIAEDGLEGCTRHGEPSADEHRAEGAREAHLHDDLLRGNAPGHLRGDSRQPMAEDRDRVPEAYADRSQREPEGPSDEREQQPTAQHHSGLGEARTANQRARGDGRRGAHQGPNRSGWIARARASRPSTMRGPGRVVTTSFVYGNTLAVRTALSFSQPDRARTVARALACVAMVGS